MTAVEGYLTDVLRWIWQQDQFLMAEMPATEDPHTNRFFEDGIAHITSSSDMPEHFVTLEDFGDELRTRANGRLEERKHGVVIRICTGRKALTRNLADIYKGHIERLLRSIDCNEGSIGDYVLEAQRFEEIAGGLRLWRAQLTATVRTRRKWQMQAANHVS
jgi:hypothetical protein